MTKATIARATRGATLEAVVDAQASLVLHALEEFDGASAKFSDALRAAMNSMVKAAVTAKLAKTEKGTKYLIELVRNAQPFVDAVAVGLILKATLNDYAQGVGRAFFHGVEWTPRLKNDKTMGLPWGKVKATAPATEGATEVDGETTAKGKAKPGKVATVTKDQAFETARTLLAQLRALNLIEVAADVLDVLLEELEGFEEPAKV